MRNTMSSNHEQEAEQHWHQLKRPTLAKGLPRCQNHSLPAVVGVVVDDVGLAARRWRGWWRRVVRDSGYE